jgi:hypothetical protein
MPNPTISTKTVKISAYTKAALPCWGAGCPAAIVARRGAPVQPSGETA